LHISQAFFFIAIQIQIAGSDLQYCNLLRNMISCLASRGWRCHGAQGDGFSSGYRYVK